jgi:hypothetical protein
MITTWARNKCFQKDNCELIKWNALIPKDYYTLQQRREEHAFKIQAFAICEMDSHLSLSFFIHTSHTKVM